MWCYCTLLTAFFQDDNTVDGTKNVRAGSRGSNRSDGEEGGEDTSSVGTWIGVVLGLIVVIGLLVLGVYFYRKQRAIATKPPPYVNNQVAVGINNGHAAGGRSDYAVSGVYGAGSNGGSVNGAGASLNGSGSGSVAGSSGAPALPGRPASMIGKRPPPPIQVRQTQGLWELSIF